MRIVLCLLIVAALGGCACAVPNAAPAAVGAAPCASCAAAPVAAPVPVAAVPVGVQYRVGAAEYTRAALSVPGSLVGCGATAVGEAGQAGIDYQCWISDTQAAQGSGMKRGDTLVIDGTTYVVGQVQPDGTGVSLVSLRT